MWDDSRLLSCPGCVQTAVLWLLLLTAGVIKWAQLSPGGSKALAGFQLAMSSGVGFALGCAVVWSGVCLLRQCLLRRAAKRRAQRSSFGSSSGGDGGAGSAPSAAGSAAALSAAGALGSAAARAGGGVGDELEELPLRLLSKRNSLLNLAAAAAAAAREPSFALQAAVPGLGPGALAPPPPLVGLQRDSTAATGAYFSASSSFKRGSTISLRGGGTCSDTGEIRAERRSCCYAPPDQILPGFGGGSCTTLPDPRPADRGAAAAPGAAAALAAVPARQVGADAASGDGSHGEGAPLLPAVPWSEHGIWR